MRPLRLLSIVAVMFVLDACDKDDPTPTNTTSTGGSSAQTKGITTSLEAKSIYGSIRSFLDGFDNNLTSTQATTTVNGDKGKATITGKKTSSSSSTSTSSTTTSTLEMDVMFSDYVKSSVLVSGGVSQYDYDYYRMACSVSTCASSNTVNEYIKASGLKVEFTYDGKKVSETININVTRTSSYGTLSGTLTTASGKSFSI